MAVSPVKLKIKKRGYMFLAIVVFIFAFNGCFFRETKQKQAEILEESVSIAPLFIHGKGIGITGDDVLIPHVFLTEKEAREIIDNELKKTNIILDKNDVEMKKIMIEKKKIALNKEEFLKGNLVSEETVIEKKSLIIDKYSTENNSGYEFISKEDYNDYFERKYKSSIQSYDLKMVAEYLNNRLNEQNEINAVVFYDPLPEINDSRVKKKLEKYQKEGNKKKYLETLKEDVEMLQKKQKEESIRLLKTQVSDYIEWIKEEKRLEEQKADLTP